MPLATGTFSRWTFNNTLVGSGLVSASFGTNASVFTQTSTPGGHAYAIGPFLDTNFTACSVSNMAWNISYKACFVEYDVKLLALKTTNQYMFYGAAGSFPWTPLNTYFTSGVLNFSDGVTTASLTGIQTGIWYTIGMGIDYDTSRVYCSLNSSGFASFRSVGYTRMTSSSNSLYIGKNGFGQGSALSGYISDLRMSFLPRITFPTRNFDTDNYIPLTTTGVSSSSIAVSWPTYTGISNFFVYKNTINSKQSASRLGIAGVGATGYTFEGLSPSTSYYFWVDGYSDSFISGYSSSGFIGTTTATQGDFSLSGLSNGVGYTPTGVACIADANTITLNWSAPSNVVSGYRVYRAYNSEQEFAPIGVTNNLDYIDSGVESNRIYYYRVTSIY